MKAEAQRLRHRDRVPSQTQNEEQKTWGWQQRLRHMPRYTATLKCKTGAKELAEGWRGRKSEQGLATFSAAGVAAHCWWPLLSATAADVNDRLTARANVRLSFQINDIWLRHCDKIFTEENLWKICKEAILYKSTEPR